MTFLLGKQWPEKSYHASRDSFCEDFAILVQQKPFYSFLSGPGWRALSTGKITIQRITYPLDINLSSG